MKSNVSLVKRGRPQKNSAGTSEAKKVVMQARLPIDRTVYMQLSLISMVEGKGVLELCSDFITKAVNSYMSKHGDKIAETFCLNLDKGDYGNTGVSSGGEAPETV